MKCNTPRRIGTDVEGVVVVTFVIDPDGTITKAIIVKEIEYRTELDRSLACD